MFRSQVLGERDPLGRLNFLEDKLQGVMLAERCARERGSAGPLRAAGVSSEPMRKATPTARV